MFLAGTVNRADDPSRPFRFMVQLVTLAR